MPIKGCLAIATAGREELIGVAVVLAGSRSPSGPNWCNSPTANRSITMPDPRSETLSQQRSNLGSMLAVRSSQCNGEQQIRYNRRGYACFGGALWGGKDVSWHIGISTPQKVAWARVGF